MIVSWGLALATWVPRLSRAIGLSVIAFLLFGMGWPIMIELLFSPMLRAQLPGAYERNRLLQDFLTSLSPLAGSMNALRLLEQCEFKPRWPILARSRFSEPDQSDYCWAVVLAYNQNLRPLSRPDAGTSEGQAPARISDPGGADSSRNVLSGFVIDRGVATC